MPLALAFSCATSFGLVALAAKATLDWRRRKSPAHRYLAMALSAIALASTLGALERVPPLRIVSAVGSLASFELSAFALLLFRGTMAPLRRSSTVAAAASLCVSGVVLLATELSTATSVVTRAEYGAAALLVVTWIACVCEPIYRLWRISAARPIVQRGRLRALAAGYGAVALILVAAIALGPAGTNTEAQMAVSVAALGIVPILAITFAPPPWVRRRWRGGEEKQLREGMHTLLVSAPDRRVLAQRGLERAVHLVGADAGLILDADRSVLARLGLNDEDSAALQDLAGRMSGPAATLSAAPRALGSVLVVPLAISDGSGALMVTAGPATPWFGTAEVSLLQHYGTSLAAAIDRVRLTEALSASEERSRLLVENIPEYALLVLDRHGVVSSSNAAVEKIFGLHSAGVMGSPFASFVVGGGEAVREWLAHAVAAGAHQATTTLRRDGGSPFPADIAITTLRHPDGRLRCFAVLIHDITERHESDRLRAMQFMVTRTIAEADDFDEAVTRILETICDALGAAAGFMWLHDTSADLMRMHLIWHRSPDLEGVVEDAHGLTRRRGQSMVGQVWESGRPMSLDDAATSTLIERTGRTGSGLHGTFAFPVLSNDDVNGVIVVMSREPRAVGASTLDLMLDIGRQIGNFVRRKRAEQALAEIACTDALTGLRNRSELERVLTQQPAPDHYAVLAIDVDELKPLNDTYGHEAGDQALRAIAAALHLGFRETDTVARTGGDEFVAFLPGTDEGQAMQIAERVRLSMYGVQMQHGHARVSIGVAANSAGETPLDTWAAADDALYRAKRAGRDRCAVGSAGASAGEANDRRHWQDMLRTVFSDEAITCVYQPLVVLSTGRVVGFEALGRPLGRKGGVESLFAAAERIGEGRNLDWLCRRMAVHGAHPLPHDSLLFINVGVSALLDPLHDVDQMLLLLRWARRNPADVVLEITEREAVHNTARLREVLASYREHGFRFAMDDVGSGHSTFEVLSVAVPEFVKVSDRLTGAAAERGPQSTIRALVSFAASSGAQVIAEGLESPADVELLQELGVPLGQGFHLGRPDTAESWAARPAHACRTADRLVGSSQ